VLTFHFSEFSRTVIIVAVRKVSTQLKGRTSAVDNHAKLPTRAVILDRSYDDLC